MRDVLDSVRREVAVVIPPPFNRFAQSFSHIFAGGYAAGYYSYLWAELLAADGFAAFVEAGTVDRAAGDRLRESFPDIVVAAAEPLPGDPVMGLRSLADGYVPPPIAAMALPTSSRSA